MTAPGPTRQSGRVAEDMSGSDLPGQPWSGPTRDRHADPVPISPSRRAYGGFRGLMEFAWLLLERGSESPQ